jgi:thymidylate kinase
MEIFEEDRDFQAGCRRTFLGFEKGRHLPDSLKTRFIVIDASRGVSEIEMDIWDIVSENL